MASTSLRSWSSCQSATGSAPARRTARTASTSSREPGKVMTPMRTEGCSSVGREVELDVLDDRVGQQRLGDLRQLGLVGGALDLEDEVLALADAADAVVAEPAQRSQHRLTLGVGDLRIQHDVDDHPRHAVEGTGVARATDRSTGEADLVRSPSPSRSRDLTLAEPLDVRDHVMSSTEGSADLGDHLVRPAEVLGGGEPQDRPARGDESVLAAEVVDEDVPVAMDVAVELHEHAPVRPGEVGSAEEAPSIVPDDVLQLRRGQAGLVEEPT